MKSPTTRNRLLVAIGIALILLGSQTPVNARGFSTCNALMKTYTNFIARSKADKDSFASAHPAYANQIAVKPKIYAQNVKLDVDQDGLLCEEEWEGILNLTKALDLMFNTTGGGSSLVKSEWSSCAFRGKNIWGSVYISDSKYSADYVVYETSSRYGADISTFLESSRYSANSCGRWYLTSSRYSADFTIYLTDSRYSADFTIYLTDSRYSAGRN